MTTPDPRGPRHRLLVALTTFVAVTAVAGGAILVLNSDGSAVGMPPGTLDGTPFASYLIPGLLLLLVVGGSASAAAYAMIRRLKVRNRLAFMSGVVLVTWLLVQLLMVGGPHLLQVLYLAVGATIVALVMPLAWDEWQARLRT